MQRILCVEDAPDVLMILEAALRGYQLTFATTTKQASEFISREQYALVLLDIELPDGTGLEVYANFFDRLRGIPVIFLTGKLDFASKVSAFSLGAEDFIIKPFDPKELKLRIDSKLRKLATGADERINLRIGPLVCNSEEQRLFKGGSRESIDLTSLEFRIFHLLAQTPNKIFSRGEILDRCWGQSVTVADRAIDVHISNLRKKLDNSGVRIEAVIGSGYRICVEKQGTNP